MANELSFKVNFDLGSVLDVSTVVNKQVFPLLHQAVKVVTQQTAADWQKAVYGAKLWSGEKDAYAKSITWSMTSDFKGVVETTYKHAQEIEQGRPARDLKKMLQTSLKVRQGKKGKYLYIPFRHNTPGNDAHAKSMPSHVYEIAKGLTPSSVLGQSTRQSQQAGKSHLTVPKNIYQWGTSLPAGLTKKAKPHHKTDIHAGMYRFDTSTPGGAKSSSYLTFRTMAEKSAGWIIPAQPGQNIAQGVAQNMQPKANAAFAQAIKKTLGG